ncbi:MAG: BamA/OMP85 family outer membrane protein [Halanaerobiales bacterium]
MGKKQLVVVLVIMLITVLSGGIYAEESIPAGETQKITAIALEGNEHVPDAEILPLIETEEGDMLDEEELKEDLQTVYDTGFFQDVSISFENYRDGLKAIFELVEYPVVKSIAIEGNKSYSDEKIKEMMNVKEERILNHKQLVEGREAVEKLYHDNGYVMAGFVDINIDDEGILALKINEGYINDIIIEGTEKTKDYVIMRELDFAAGDILNIEKMQKSFQKLVRLDYFQEFNPRLQRAEGSENSSNVIIDVDEAKTGNLGAGVTWSSKDGWLGFVNIKESNLMGNGQSLGFNWEFGGVNNYSLSFQEPWLLDTPTSFGINLYDKNAERTDSDDEDYDEHRRGGSISLGHKIVEDWNGKIRFKIEDSTVDYENDALETKRATVRSLTLQADRDTTDHPFNPTSGGIDTFSIEYAGQILGGTENFSKYNLDVRRFYPGFKQEHAWGLRAKAGAGEGKIPELEKYRLGGSESLRGYEYGSFSGNDMLLLNVEYRFPIVENFTGVLFADGGNAWESHDQVSLDSLHYSLGAGIRLNTPIGQVRLDYGFNEDGGGQPHFSIGHAF